MTIADPSPAGPTIRLGDVTLAVPAQAAERLSLPAEIADCDRLGVPVLLHCAADVDALATLRPAPARGAKPTVRRLCGPLGHDLGEWLVGSVTGLEPREGGGYGARVGLVRAVESRRRAKG